MDDFATIPWYPNVEEYERFRSSADDPEVFFASFEDWLNAAVEHEKRASDYGVLVIRIRMTIARFNDWQKSTGCRNDLTGRSQFAEQAGSKLLGNTTFRGTADA